MWVARDKDTSLTLFTGLKPVRSEEHGWWWMDENLWKIDPSLFPDLKWEDEPIEIDFVQKTNENV